MCFFLQFRRSLSSYSHQNCRPDYFHCILCATLGPIISYRFVQCVSKSKENFNHMFLRVNFLFSFPSICCSCFWFGIAKKQKKYEWNETKSKRMTGQRSVYDMLHAAEPNIDRWPHRVCVMRSLPTYCLHPWQKLWHSDVRNRFLVIPSSFFFFFFGLARFGIRRFVLPGRYCVLHFANSLSVCEKHIFLFEKLSRSDWRSRLPFHCFQRSFVGQILMCPWALWHHTYHSSFEFLFFFVSFVSFSAFRCLGCRQLNMYFCFRLFIFIRTYKYVGVRVLHLIKLNIVQLTESFRHFFYLYACASACPHCEKIDTYGVKLLRNIEEVSLAYATICVYAACRW